MPTIFERLQHSWNAFRGRDRPDVYELGEGSWQKPDRLYYKRGTERSIITAIYNRIAMDVANHKFEHVIIDDDEFYIKTVKDSLNDRLTVEANIDQTSRAFFQDVVFSLFDEGNIAIIPVKSNISPMTSDTFSIESMRTAKIITWYPKHVTVEAYDEETGKISQQTFPKSSIAIIENPFYAVMNEPNSVLQRLIRKLNILDAVDEQSGSGKLNMIIQLPYVIKSPARKQQAEQRRKDIESQLEGSKFGIAYTDGTERITQLNRPLENNLMSQIEYLMSTLYSQLGITPEILNGTASEEVMLNYNSRTVEPILAAIVDEMKRKFLTKTARTRGHSIMFSNEPFKLSPVSKIAEIAEKFVGNGILTPNELRSVVGFKPSADPSAEELGNRRINPEESGTDQEADPNASPDINQNGSEELETSESPPTGNSDNIANVQMSQVNEVMSKYNRSG